MIHKFIFGLLVSLLVACLSVVGLASPATAVTCFPGTNLCQGGKVTHSNDTGYDRAIIVFCNFGAPWENRKYVEEGTNSNQDCGDDTDQIYLRDGEDLWCKSGDPQVPWVRIFAADQERHKINDFWEMSCTLRLNSSGPV